MSDYYTIADTHAVAVSDLISEVSSYQGYLCTPLYQAGTMHSVLIEEVSSLKRCPH